jgi:tetratricopeptide (TPR) repeat protein
VAAEILILVVSGSSKRVRWIFALALAGTVLVAGGFGWWVIEDHGVVTHHVPDQPNLESWPAELKERMTAAGEKARGYFRPAAGLEELGRLYHANGFFDEAMLCYEGLHALHPREARWVYLRATILAREGRLEDAEPLYREAIALSPDYLPGRLRLGDVLLKANRLDEARAIYTEVISQVGDEPYALLGLARGAMVNGDWEQARGLLLRSIAKDPNFIGGLSLLATVHLHLGQTAEAAVITERVNRREFVDLPDPWVDGLIDDCYDPYYLSVAAAVANFRGDTASAKQRLERAIRLSSSPASLHRQLGHLYHKSQQLTEARSHLEQAAALGPGDPDTWITLVNVLLAAGDRQGAYRKVIAGIAHCPESGALRFTRGRMLHEDGQLAAAVAELQASKRLRPSEALAYVELATVYFKLGEVGAGIAEMKGALAAQPDHPVALVVVARDAIHHGDRVAAREWIRRMRAQSRVVAEDLAMVIAEFQQTFGELP